MTTLDDIAQAAAPHHLATFGVVTGAETPDGIGTLVLLGPQEPGFWPAFTASPEYADTAPDAMDRWSSRVIGGLARDLDGTAFFPFGGPPYQPFVTWAKASGRAHSSPVGLLVHDAAGLMISYRGALGFGHIIDAPAPPPNPCDSCATRPCLTACPVDAFATGTYEIDACKADLDRPENDCMSKGCAVRRACPVSQSYGRLEDQSAFHMRAFK